ncbi:MAG: Asp-tRNA(Asn)/Glu-tRNA(Gln) amidotransferase subunit GatC [Candidatus Ancillula sp.]|jgi:aspartyl-tRNA(Asn)/glutamyl-tRNA(Gln) amidotransferase subunit C|nr:Asp-tRNA(Asn)/Glu-tRNA(Gln) amidotransferase subunit GatC [Candidatus Ancillula sp.]
MSEHFSKDDISHLATLARIDLRDDEILRLTKDLNVINDAIAKVSEVANEDVEATSHPLPLRNVFREDIPATVASSHSEPYSVNGTGENPFEGDLLTVEDALSGGPKVESGQFVAPQILGEE